jgi:hypothetical protein
LPNESLLVLHCSGAAAAGAAVRALSFMVKTLSNNLTQISLYSPAVLLLLLLQQQTLQS